MIENIADGSYLAYCEHILHIGRPLEFLGMRMDRGCTPAESKKHFSKTLVFERGTNWLKHVAKKGDVWVLFLDKIVVILK